MRRKKPQEARRKDGKRGKKEENADKVWEGMAVGTGISLISREGSETMEGTIFKRERESRS